MTRRFGLLLVLSTLILAPSSVQARGYRGGYIVTPYGSINSNSPEWKMSGGNIYVYQQIMEQKMMMQQEQMMMKQQQQYMQQMQKLQKAGKLNGFNAPQNTGFNNVNSLAPRGTTRKKRRPTLTSKSATTKAKTAETSSTKKAADTGGTKADKGGAKADKGGPKADTGAPKDEES